MTTPDPPEGSPEPGPPGPDAGPPGAEPGPLGPVPPPPDGFRPSSRGETPDLRSAERRRRMWESREVQLYRREARRRGWGPPWGPPPARPEWWPSGEPWPPAGGHARPWRGFGCLFGLLFVTGVLGVLALGIRFVGDILEAPGPAGVIIRLAALLVLVAILAGLVRGGFAIRKTGGVLDDLVRQTARVEAGDYTARVESPDRVPDPVRDLTRGFNTMAARLEADETQRRTLLADVTHELRTPLAVVQGNVEAILDGVHPADEVHLGGDPRGDPRPRPADRGPPDPGAERGRVPVAPSRADRSRRPHRRRDDLVRRGSRHRRRGDRDRARPGAAAARRRSGPDPGGDRQPRRERPAPHSGRRLDHDLGSSRG